MPVIRLECPGCGHPLTIRAARPARADDLTMCWRCSTVGIVGIGPCPRVLTDDELARLSPVVRAEIERTVARTLERMGPVARA